MQPLILTARMHPEAQAYFDELRKRYFPPERNFLRAHVTLFHALPQAKMDAIRPQLAALVRRESPLSGRTYKLQSLGRGVAFVVACPGLLSLRKTLKDLWYSDLTPQDRQDGALHITVQNKVTSESARALLHTLNRDFKPQPILFEGVDL